MGISGLDVLFSLRFGGFTWKERVVKLGRAVGIGFEAF